MKGIKTTLLIATYNWPEALELVLSSVNNQSKMPNEIIIADDGSTPETKILIDRFKLQFPMPIKHIWHKDAGFRKSQILNKAVAQASCNYIIQVDGDCIMHKHFIKDHSMFASANMYLFGSRVNIRKSYLETLFNKKQIKFNPFSKGIRKRTRAIYSTVLSSFYKEQHFFSKKFRGCNTSYFKSDFIAVNGYNEDITGWGREDSELMLRMHNNGLRSKRLRYRGIIYHIWHNEKSKDRLETNDFIEQKTIANKITWTINGIDKYL